ncbi:phosphatases II [Thelephora ganbajun]|uniref:Phosphatases II n=1 Tax=Thelephora ganbajun TaxID=370292 RepID=A0ACB6ZCM0_THEGA|nr:phosphatases II [Thelephora ganbajun]
MSFPSSRERLALQLAHLASQHQQSEYNCLKFGPNGAAATYVPISLHTPDRVKFIRAHQESLADIQAWWIATKQTPLMTPSAESPQLCAMLQSKNLIQEISAAMGETLPNNNNAFTTSSIIKTSESHPINTSTIVTPELLPVISSHLVRNPYPYPILYELPPPFRLHRVNRRPPFTNIPPPPIPHQLSDEIPTLSPHAGLRNGASVSQALQLAMSTGITGRVRNLPSRVPTPLGLKATPAFHERAITLETKQPVIGNMLLSSCPGKKVRLTGPVNGRVGVCRDLSRDLERMRTLGVGCIICCLDDTELTYLGVSWSDYARIADEICIDVLRIPLPEGLTPLDVASFDIHMTRLIDAYTLKGVNVLCHCRGGVGRAGLVACCWMLKMGLCGWLEGERELISPRGATPSTDDSETDTDAEDGQPIRTDTIQMVERVISVVRRRRSVKAIESSEQVLFLVEFVEYLRSRGRDRDSESE